MFGKGRSMHDLQRTQASGIPFRQADGKQYGACGQVGHANLVRAAVQVLLGKKPAAQVMNKQDRTLADSSRRCHYRDLL